MKGNKGNKGNRGELGKIEKIKIEIKIKIRKVKNRLSTWGGGAGGATEQPAAREPGLPLAAGWDCNGTNSAAF